MKTPFKELQPPATSPSPSKVKARVTEKIQQLSKKRSKRALFQRNYLKNLIDGGPSPVKKETYQRRKLHPGREAAVSFLHDVSINLPGKKSVSKMQQRKVLPKRMKRLHRDFKLSNPGVSVSLRTMYRRKPGTIKTSRHSTYRQCLCEICTNIDLKLDTLNKFLGEYRIDGRDVLSDMSLCRVSTLDCINRTCSSCGVNVVRTTLTGHLETSMSQSARWKSWDMVQTEKGKRRELVVHQSSVSDLFGQLLVDLSTFSKHLFVFRWQYMQLRTLRANLLHTWAIVTCDFAENYLCKYQSEVQSAHWGYNQVTVHPVVLEYRCFDCAEPVMDYLVFLSDDLNHDSNMVQVILEKTKVYLQGVMQLEKMVIFSDGCAAQYKSKLPFFHLAQTADADVQMERCYFGSRHGKSLCDACGGVVKRAVDDDVRAGNGTVVIQSASVMLDHCQKHYTLPVEQEQCSHLRRSFHLVKSSEINRSRKSSSLGTVPGTRQLHHVRPIARDVLATRKLACFCPACISCKFSDCQNKGTVDEWEIVRFKIPDLPQEAVSHSPQEAVPDLPQEAVPDLPQEAVPDLPQEAVSHSPQEAIPDPPQEAVPDPSQDVGPDPPQATTWEREAFFLDLAHQMQNCPSYLDLEALVERSYEKVMSYSLPSVMPTYMSDTEAEIDVQAFSLIPPTVPEGLFPVQTEGDGNCFPRSVSTLVFGHPRNFVEVRCRVVTEHVLNKAAYLAGIGLGQDVNECQSVVAMQVVLAEGSGSTGPETVTADDIKCQFEREVLAVAQNGTYMGLWQVSAAANVVGRPVCSVYPQKGWHTYQVLNKRTVLPFFAPYQEVEPVFLMWTSTRLDQSDENWTSNHFVPLMRKRLDPDEASVRCDEDAHNNAFIEVLTVGNFFTIDWKGTEYVAQLKQLEDNLAKVSFLHWKEGFGFFFPPEADLSWEDMSSLKEEVFLEMDLGKSTHRVQYFKRV